MTTKFTNFYTFQGHIKYTKIVNFGMQLYHLATLEKETAGRAAPGSDPTTASYEARAIEKLAAHLGRFEKRCFLLPS
jgi:hypothetical protein